LVLCFVFAAGAAVPSCLCRGGLGKSFYAIYCAFGCLHEQNNTSTACPCCLGHLCWVGTSTPWGRMKGTHVARWALHHCCWKTPPPSQKHTHTPLHPSQHTHTASTRLALAMCHVCICLPWRHSGDIGEDPNDIPNNLMPYIQQVHRPQTRTPQHPHPCMLLASVPAVLSPLPLPCALAWPLIPPYGCPASQRGVDPLRSCMSHPTPPPPP
jgi:hypothetical protein